MAAALRARDSGRGPTALVMMPDGTRRRCSHRITGFPAAASFRCNAPIHSFHRWNPSKRHEVMLRLGLTGRARSRSGFDPQIRRQAMAERLTQLVLGSTTLLIDGANPEALYGRADFMTVDLTGALPRRTRLPRSSSTPSWGSSSPTRPRDAA